MSAFEQHEPQPIETSPNDEVLGGNLLSMGHIKDPRHKQYQRTLNDIFDEQREKFPTILEFVEYDPKTGSRVVRYDPFKPEQQNTELIDSKSFLYSLAQLNKIVSYDPEFNENINLLVDEKNKRDWVAATNKGPIEIAMGLQHPESISGIGITFGDNDGGKHDYRITMSFYNEDNHMTSQVLDITPSSMTTNTKQFFLLNHVVENISRIKIQLEEQTTDATSRYALKNISIFNYTNSSLLRSMSEHNIILCQEIENPIFLKEMSKDDIDILKEDGNNNNPAPTN